MPEISTTGAIIGSFAPDPILGTILGGLFGGTGSTFQPYIDENGNYVWSNPNKNNPVPLTDIPGASRKPDKSYRQEAGIVKQITDLLPYYTRALAGQITPWATAELDAMRATSPAYNQLMLDLYKQFAPQFNQVGSDIARQNALAQVQSDADTLALAQKTLIPAARSAAELYDPEYFATRTLTANRLADLLKSIDLSSGLTPTERREIEQGLAQENASRGLTASPSQTATVSNAMQYGQAGYNRVQANRSALSSAINAATAALPTLKSGTDVFQVATGKPSVPNAGASQFNGTNMASSASSTASSLGQGFFNAANQNSMNNAQLAVQQALGEKDWADYLGQVTGSIGNIVGAAGGAVAMCWIARRVYGEDNPLWQSFRRWLMLKAPAEFRNLYIKAGQKFADSLTVEQVAKLKPIFNKILSVNY